MRAGELIFRQNPPLGLYVHLPWCVQKCPYCDFNSHAAGDFDEFAYISKLIEDLQQDLPLVWGRQVSSIFIGGGTPSLFSGKAIERLLSELRACLNFNPAIEITLEANPGSADAANFAAYFEAGINRLSLGVQSFDDDCLGALGRVHDRAAALAAVRHARDAGCENLNLDLMFGLPGQTPAMAEADIAAAIELQPQHISHYQLTIEPNTRFHVQPPAQLPDDDETWRMQESCQQRLAAQGYQQYEISAYALENRQCHHNLNYWQFGDYMGIGAGAHGKLTLAAQGEVIRRQRLRQPQQYFAARGNALISKETSLNREDLVFEFMLNALRLTGGFDLALFSSHCGLNTDFLRPGLKQAESRELVQLDNDWLRPTELGLRFHNDLQAIFLDIEIPPHGQLEIPLNSIKP